MNFRAIQPIDAEALLRLWDSACPYDPLTADLLHEKIWGDTDFDPELALLAEHENKVLALAVAVCRKRTDGDMAFVKLLAVDPSTQRQGLGTRLLAELEARCQARSALEIRPGESAPNYLTPGIDSRSAAACQFFTEHGYEAIGEACNMHVDLREWPSPGPRALPAPVVKIARVMLAQQPAIRQFVVQHWPSWWAELQQALANRPITLFIASDNGEVVGFAAYDANNLGTGWFGPMGTAPECRGKGIGSALLAACLADMAEKYGTAIIPWVGPVEFYQRAAGAEVVRTFVRYRKSLSTRANV